MIINNCEQMSEEWFSARCGIPSASNFSKLITATGKASTQATAYRRELLAEWVTGEKQQVKQNDWMQRGIELEPEARQYYEFSCDAKVTEVGIVYHDDRKLVSCSPDGLIDGTKGLEIKCPAPGTQVGYLIDNKLPTTYIAQVQGSLWVCGLESWDFLSYHPDIDPLLINVERDEKWISNFEPIIESFIDTMLEERELLIQRGIKKLA